MRRLGNIQSKIQKQRQAIADLEAYLATNSKLTNKHQIVDKVQKMFKGVDAFFDIITRKGKAQYEHLFDRFQEDPIEIASEFRN